MTAPQPRLKGRSDCREIKSRVLAIFALALQDFESGQVVEDRAKELSAFDEHAAEKRITEQLKEQLCAMKANHKKKLMSDREFAKWLDRPKANEHGKLSFVRFCNSFPQAISWLSLRKAVTRDHTVRAWIEGVVFSLFKESDGPK